MLRRNTNCRHVQDLEPGNFLRSPFETTLSIFRSRLSPPVGEGLAGSVSGIGATRRQTSKSTHAAGQTRQTPPINQNSPMRDVDFASYRPNSLKAANIWKTD
jgi:hypothetical protein